MVFKAENSELILKNSWIKYPRTTVTSVAPDANILRDAERRSAPLFILHSVISLGRGALMTSSLPESRMFVRVGYSNRADYSCNTIYDLPTVKRRD